MKLRARRLAIVLLPLYLLCWQDPTNLLSQVVSAPVDSLEPVKKEELSTYEKSFKPSEYDSSLQLLHQKETVPNPLLNIPLDSLASAQPDTVQGFRIQVFSTDDYDEAILTRNNLNAELPDQWVYMVYDAPVYKIRVGDYINRADANRAIEGFVEKGYKDAWVVPDRVIKNPLPKPPLSPVDSTVTIGN